MDNKLLIKKVRFDFMTNGNFGACHVEADCQTKEDLKEVYEFTKELSNLIPHCNTPLNNMP